MVELACGALPYAASVEGCTHDCGRRIWQNLLEVCGKMVVASLVDIVVVDFRQSAARVQIGGKRHRVALGELQVGKEAAR
jgi:hypothetical protein